MRRRRTRRRPPMSISARPCESPPRRTQPERPARGPLWLLRLRVALGGRLLQSGGADRNGADPSRRRQERPRRAVTAQGAARLPPQRHRQPAGQLDAVRRLREASAASTNPHHRASNVPAGARVCAPSHDRWSGDLLRPWPSALSLNLNRRPHPYHGTTGNRCADRRFPRSRPTVRAEVIGSLPAKLCVLDRCMTEAQRPLEVWWLARAWLPSRSSSVPAALEMTTRRPAGVASLAVAGPLPMGSSGG